MRKTRAVLLVSALLTAFSVSAQQESIFRINELGYYDIPGLNVMAFQDFYPDGHQGGITVIQNGIRVLSNGDVRLEPAPGQWSPIPKKLKRVVDTLNNEITTTLCFPDSSRDKKSFNPINYPDLDFVYHIRIQPEGNFFNISIDLDKPLPDEWYGKVGFNIELFPGFYFGKSFVTENTTGIFPRQVGGPAVLTNENLFRPKPLAKGKELFIASENEDERIGFTANGNDIFLYDGRGEHNNGFFVVNVLLQKGKLKDAARITITPSYTKGWKYSPVIHVSQVGYAPKQHKTVVLELDKNSSPDSEISVQKLNSSNRWEKILSESPASFGHFLRYNYFTFDFSSVTDEGLYKIVYGDVSSNVFRIAKDVYKRGVWQPTLEYFLPVQMCHMRVNDRYRVWHGLCHDDDALMAPVDHIHFDGYAQDTSTLTKYKPGEHICGLNTGGWHDAGDYDLRVESQSNTVRRLAQMWELFNVKYDVTSIDENKKITEMHRPDGKPDILQQIEHGALSVVGGYRSLGRLYRGIICQDLRQYTLLGDASIMTDNLIYDNSLPSGEKTGTSSSVNDDRWVFTEVNPKREISSAACMATAYRALKGFNDTLATQCLDVATVIWDRYSKAPYPGIIDLSAELFLSTSNKKYLNLITENVEIVKKNIKNLAPAVGRVKPSLDKKFIENIYPLLKKYSDDIRDAVKKTPFGVQYKPDIWGAGWGIQGFGVNQYFLHRGFPEIFDGKPVFSALNFILGVHPGINTSSFVSGVGVKSVTVAYGVNRVDWSYIPGGSVSGTALIRPDFPELKTWPFFWQQTEYVMGGGATNFMFLVLAVKDMLNE